MNKTSADNFSSVLESDVELKDALLPFCCETIIDTILSIILTEIKSSLGMMI